jgi:hypothetical protein
MAGEKQLTSAQVADAWANITIKEWRTKIVAQKMNRSNQLWQSFITNVVSQADGDLVKIEFAFKYYGKFVDMGVGKGTKLGGVTENKTSRRVYGKMLGNRRRPKKWYSKTLQHEIYRLADVLGIKYSKAVASEIVNDIVNTADNSIKGGARINI